MERHRCKLCLKNFANGRALGGHMRSHMLNLYVPPKSEHEPLGDETELDSVSSSSSEEELQELDDDDGDDDDDDHKCLFVYGLRENPKKSVRLVDPKFSSFHVAHDQAAGSVVLQDRESETESPKNPVPRRSKRVRKSGNCEQLVELKKPKLVYKLGSGQTESASWVDPEPVSSISDTSPEEDVAYCLMMMSRDKWRREKEAVVVEDDEQEQEEDYYYEQSDNESDHEEIKVSKPSRSRAKYKCDTCNKVFKSYQALGGHRASHKKIRLNNNNTNNNNAAGGSIQDEDRDNAGVVEEKIHECPVCFRVFASGQALGGHKRSHVIGSSATIVAPSVANNTRLVHANPVAKQAEMSLIDLNLPAPMEDEDEISQIELSAVSDGEFVKSH